LLNRGLACDQCTVTNSNIHLSLALQISPSTLVRIYYMVYRDIQLNATIYTIYIYYIYMILWARSRRPIYQQPTTNNQHHPNFWFGKIHPIITHTVFLEDSRILKIRVFIFNIDARKKIDLLWNKKVTKNDEKYCTLLSSYYITYCSCLRCVHSMYNRKTEEICTMIPWYS
jgi:hypothetical protein